jgi:hypothetical protein
MDRRINTFILFMDETPMIGFYFIFMTIFDSFKSDVLKQKFIFITIYSSNYQHG